MRRSGRGLSGLFFAAGVGHYEADLFIGDLLRHRFLDGSQQIQPEVGGGLEDVLLVDRMHPIGPERGFTFFDEVRDENNDRRNFSATKLGNLLESAALVQQFQSFLGRA